MACPQGGELLGIGDCSLIPPTNKCHKHPEFRLYSQPQSVISLGKVNLWHLLPVHFEVETFSTFKFEQEIFFTKEDYPKQKMQTVFGSVGSAFWRHFSPTS